MEDSPKQLVRALTKRYSLNQGAIVAELKKLGVKTSQPTISRVGRGHEKISFQLARGLARLHERISQPNS
jgi:hypothetical protein